LTFFEGYITLDLDSADIFRGIGIFCRFFSLKDFVSYRALNKVWADLPTAMRFRAKKVVNGKGYFVLGQQCVECQTESTAGKMTGKLTLFIYVVSSILHNCTFIETPAWSCCNATWAGKWCVWGLTRGS
jgi:hypothetical protein